MYLHFLLVPIILWKLKGLLNIYHNILVNGLRNMYLLQSGVLRGNVVYRIAATFIFIASKVKIPCSTPLCMYVSRCDSCKIFLVLIEWRVLGAIKEVEEIFVFIFSPKSQLNLSQIYLQTGKVKCYEKDLYVCATFFVTSLHFTF